MSKVGNFEINVWANGYPVWCEVNYGQETVMKLHHNELSDLKYAVEKAMQEAKRALPDIYKDEV